MGRKRTARYNNLDINKNLHSVPQDSNYAKPNNLHVAVPGELSPEESSDNNGSASKNSDTFFNIATYSQQTENLMAKFIVDLYNIGRPISVDDFKYFVNIVNQRSNSKYMAFEDIVNEPDLHWLYNFIETNPVGLKKYFATPYRIIETQSRHVVLNDDFTLEECNSVRRENYQKNPFRAMQNLRRNVIDEVSWLVDFNEHEENEPSLDDCDDGKRIVWKAFVDIAAQITEEDNNVLQINVVSAPKNDHVLKNVKKENEDCPSEQTSNIIGMTSSSLSYSSYGSQNLDRATEKVKQERPTRCLRVKYHKTPSGLRENSGRKTLYSTEAEALFVEFVREVHKVYKELNSCDVRFFIQCFNIKHDIESEMFVCSDNDRFSGRRGLPKYDWLYLFISRHQAIQSCVQVSVPTRQKVKRRVKIRTSSSADDGRRRQRSKMVFLMFDERRIVQRKIFETLVERDCGLSQIDQTDLIKIVTRKAFNSCIPIINKTRKKEIFFPKTKTDTTVSTRSDNTPKQSFVKSAGSRKKRNSTTPIVAHRICTRSKRLI